MNLNGGWFPPLTGWRSNGRGFDKPSMYVMVNRFPYPMELCDMLRIIQVGRRKKCNPVKILLYAVYRSRFSHLDQS